MKTHQILTAAAILTASLSACGGGGAAPAPTVKTIELTPAALTVTAGKTGALTATARDEQGQAISGVTFTWKSSAETVATVAGGVVRGVTTGNAQVTASAAGVTGAAAVTVTPPAPAAGFTLTVPEHRLPVITGTSAAVTVTVTRTGAFTGPVTVSLTGLPAGASSAPVTIPAGATSATVTVTAAPSAAHSQPTPVTLTGAAAGTGPVSIPLTVTVRGPAGSLDTTFGAGGRVTTAVGQSDDYGHAVALQEDGKIVVVGTALSAAGGNEFAVSRYGRDGVLDPTFGTGGTVLVDFAGKSDVARTVTLQPDGKIVVGGGATTAANEERFGLLRLTATGAPDPSFGSGGRVITAITGSGADRINAVIMQADGKIVAGGQASFGSATSGVDFALARYTPAGTLDGTFGTGGTVVTAVRAGSGTDAIHSLAIQGGAVIAVGGEGDFLAARYLATGALDPAFGTGGTVSGVFGGTIGVASSVAVDRAGRLLLAGQADNDTAVVRLTAAGTLDATFGTGGKVKVPLSSNWDAAEGLAVQADGKIVLAGWRMPDAGGSATDFTVTRLQESGALDTGFGVGGTAVTPVAPGIKTDQAHAMALQPDDRVPATRIVAVGERNDSDNDVALTRYWP